MSADARELHAKFREEYFATLKHNRRKNRRRRIITLYESRWPVSRERRKTDRRTTS